MRIKTQIANSYQNLRVPDPPHLHSANALALLYGASVHRGEGLRMPIHYFVYAIFGIVEVRVLFLFHGFGVYDINVDLPP